MELVIDASVIIAVISNESQKARLVAATQGSTLIAPSSVHWEIGNAFSAMLKRGRITLDKASEAIEVYHQIPLRLVSIELSESLLIAKELDIYAYDAYLIRCALKYAAPLITLDSNLKRVAKAKGVVVVE
jgi:predicted nucleic acid-binding protein